MPSSPSASSFAGEREESERARAIAAPQAPLAAPANFDGRDAHHRRPADAPPSFGALMRAQRTARGLTLQQIARRIGCAKAYLSMIETGHRAPPAADLIYQLERVLGFESGQLFEAARWANTPREVLEEVILLRARERAATELARQLLEDATQHTLAPPPVPASMLPLPPGSTSVFASSERSTPRLTPGSAGGSSASSRDGSESVPSHDPPAKPGTKKRKRRAAAPKRRRDSRSSGDCDTVTPPVARPSHSASSQPPRRSNRGRSAGARRDAITNDHDRDRARREADETSSRTNRKADDAATAGTPSSTGAAIRSFPAGPFPRLTLGPASPQPSQPPVPHHSPLGHAGWREPEARGSQPGFPRVPRLAYGGPDRGDSRSASYSPNANSSRGRAFRLRPGITNLDALLASGELHRLAHEAGLDDAVVHLMTRRRSGRDRGGNSNGETGGGMTAGRVRINLDDDRDRDDVDDPQPLRQRVPIINKVAAGTPHGFTDLDYPAGVADDYLALPDEENNNDHTTDRSMGLPAGADTVGATAFRPRMDGHEVAAAACDERAGPRDSRRPHRVPVPLESRPFAAQIVGDSMAPEYVAGDVVIFSPEAPVLEGSDCFVRLEPDHEATFKRIHFERPDGTPLDPLRDDPSAEPDLRIRLQPLNPAYEPRVVSREEVAGLYAAVSVVRKVRAAGRAG